MSDAIDPIGGLIPAVQNDPLGLESIPAGEAAAIAASVQALEARVRAAAATTGGVAHRDAHNKAHGCVQAELRVLDDLAPELRVGLFAAPRAYSAWVRFSNGSGTPQKDSLGDGRGMAVKVLGVEGSASTTQDFLAIDAPVFFVRNAVDYVAFNQSENPMGFFLPGGNPFRLRLHELLNALSIAWRKATNPLNLQYYSMTPYLFGDRACKFTWRPIGAPSPFNDTSTPQFLHDNLVRSLAQADAAFELCVQLQRDRRAQPVEDPTIEWSEHAAPFVPVARLTIPAQAFDTPERAAFAENLSYTPWHGLPAHRPLGGINRARRAVYEAISRLRHEINGVARSEPPPFALALPAAPFQSRTEVTPMVSIKDGLDGLLGSAIDACGWVDNESSKAMIDTTVSWTRNRPHPWSTASDYTSWKALTDKTYQARHLPASDLPVLPPTQEVLALFARPNGVQTLSNKSTCLFPAFAQYLVDGFIRTNTSKEPDARTRTTSNHEIDLCQLYGRTEAQTDLLRAMDGTPGRKGRLKSQVLNGEEYPLFLYDRTGTTVDPVFAQLDKTGAPVMDPPLLGPPGAPTPPPQALATLFAIGGDRANATPFTAMMNTLFFREHNRIAGVLDAQNPGWDDERVFQVARNIMIPLFIKIVIEQYINHISPIPFNLTADPSVAWAAKWNRPNWITAEFSLLYRWHSLIPDWIDWPTGRIDTGAFPLNNQPLIDVGLGAAFAAAAAQPAAALGALNTNRYLMQVESLAINQARENRLASYNDYRVHFSMTPATTFADITSNPQVAAILEGLYGDPNHVEFYPGLFAEDRADKSPLPTLLMRMVAVDAFSQALTNPLLSEHVWNETTFTPWGFQLIKDTHSLGQILERQGTKVDPAKIVMTQPDWRFGWHLP